MPIGSSAVFKGRLKKTTTGWQVCISSTEKQKSFINDVIKCKKRSQEAILLHHINPNLSDDWERERLFLRPPDEDLERLLFRPLSGDSEDERDLFLEEAEPLPERELDLLKMKIAGGFSSVTQTRQSSNNYTKGTIIL